MTRASVDLPLPDSPTRPTVWPGAMLRLTPSTATTRPPSTLKVLCTSVADMSASVA